MQRRKFLRTAGVGGATIAAAGTLAADLRDALNKMSGTLRGTHPRELVS